MTHEFMHIASPILMMGAGARGTMGQLLMMVIAFFMSMLNEVFSRNIHKLHVYDTCMRLFFGKKTEYRIQCNVVYKHNTYYDNTMTLQYKAVMLALYQKLLKDENTHLKYHIVEENISYSDTSSIKIVVFDNPRTKYMLTESVQIVHTFMEDRSEKNDYIYHMYTIELSSIHNRLEDVIAFVKDVMASYDEHQLEEISKCNRIYTLSHFDETTHKPNYNHIEFVTSKTFDNMFFDEKTALMQRLDDFATNRDRYQRLGIPYTLGFMFHGTPGTGKTSAIKAIASYTNRHIMIIPVRLVNTAEKLRTLFMTERINDILVPMHKRLYVFEEIDCSQWQTVVMSRSLLHHGKRHNSGSAIESRGDTAIRELVSMLKNSEDLSGPGAPRPPQKFDLTLGDLLDILDGMIEMPGRMIVMTSNHPDVIDPALLRPGRIDMIVRFAKLSREHVANMYHLWFGEAVPPDVLERIPDRVYSQAEIGNIFSNTNRDDVLSTLMNEKVPKRSTNSKPIKEYMSKYITLPLTT